MSHSHSNGNYQGFDDEEEEHSTDFKLSHGVHHRHKRSLSHSRHEGSDKLVIVLVGLPARGKSYIAKKIQIYLGWRGHTCKVFNVGQERRRRASHLRHDAQFFHGKNTKANKIRTEVALHVLEKVIMWINQDGGQVGIFDATNTTKARRELLVDRCNEAGIRLLFIESICNDPSIIDENLRMKISRSPDYENVPPDKALTDIKQRIKNYESVYETLNDDEELSYIKIINMSSKLEAYKVTGGIPRLLIIFVMNLHADQKYVKHIRKLNSPGPRKSRKIWICRAGNTTHDPVGDGSAVPYKTEHCALSTTGVKFSKNLASFIEAQNIEGEYQVWTSTLNRAVETISYLPKAAVSSTHGALKMVHQGVCYGMSPSRIRKKFPELYDKWQADPFRYRFSGGESYMDVVQRLEPLVVDIEQLSCPILIVTHLSCLRILYAYFKGSLVEKCPSLNFPQGEIIQFSPSLYGWQEEKINLMDDELIDNMLHDSTDSSS